MYDMCTATQEVSPPLERLCRNLADGRLSSRANARDLVLKILRLRLRTLRGFLAEFILSFVEGLEMTEKNWMKVLALTVLTFLLAVDLVHAQALTRIRVANIGGTSDHIQVAINGGIYRKHGFDVENIQVGSSAAVVQSLIAGEVSFAHVGAVPVVAAVASGIDLKIVAVFINRFNYVMVTLPDLQKPQDLKGKTLAISRLGSGDEFATREALRRWGLDPDKDVRLLQVGLTMARLAALQGRHVQASLLSPPQIVEVQRMGLNVMADLTDLDVEYAHYTLVTKGSLIAENRPFVDRFMRAYVDGIKFYRSHPEVAIPYLRKFSKQSEAELRIVYENLRKRIREEPVPTTGGVQTIIRSLRTDKEKELDPRRVIDTSFLAGVAAR
jgi:ABC-type nitrate/sulfonate/bicarbonate transport system substrate-binding protein